MCILNILYTHHNVVILVKETIEKPHGGAKSKKQ